MASHRDAASLGPEGYPIDWHGVRAFYRVVVDAPTEVDRQGRRRLHLRGPLDAASRRSPRSPPDQLTEVTAEALRAARLTVGRVKIRRVGAYGLCRDAERPGAARPRLRRQSEFPGVWTLPGGGVEQGEHPDDAVVREFAEETGSRCG